jgi:2-keto-4-pentenoate hydratase/2-oxohepta-3-ene-1,7-dioic acid hydratase in catechol pathway
MRLATFEYQGHQSYGVVMGDSIVDAGRYLADRAPDLRSAIAGNLLHEIAEIARWAQPDFALADVKLLPVIPNPGKILCVGLNYETHRLETGRAESSYPAIFTRFADTQVGHEGLILRPSVSQQLDYEGELAVIIGKSGRAIDEARALEYVAGYACFNDASVRDWQRHTHQFTPGKNFPSTGGFGPWMVTPDEVGDVTALTLTTRLNGQEMQHSTTDLLIFPVPTLIAYISAFTPLSPGDVICTGTPGGVGYKREPPVFMKPGDVVEVDISRIGILSNHVADEPVAESAHLLADGATAWH